MDKKIQIGNKTKIQFKKTVPSPATEGQSQESAQTMPEMESPVAGADTALAIPDHLQERTDDMELPAKIVAAAPASPSDSPTGLGTLFDDGSADAPGPAARQTKDWTDNPAVGQTAANKKVTVATKSRIAGDSLQPGTRLLHYEIQKKLGAGAMGVVFLAQDTQLKRQVAIKTLHSHVTANPEYLARFQREAQALAQVRHPYVLQIYGLHEDNGIHFFSMEFIKGGESLSDLLEKRKYLDEREAMAFITQIAQGLLAVHQAGIVHRDIKPANIMMDRGVPRLMDFGIVLWNEKELKSSPAGHAGSAGQPAAPSLTAGGKLVGTPFYLAPECIQGEKATIASDIYAMGVMLFEMISGEPPFGGTTIQAVLLSHLHKQPPSLQQLKQQVTPAVAELVKTMIAREPSQRFKNIRELLQAFNKITTTWEQEQKRLAQKKLGKEFAAIMAQSVSTTKSTLPTSLLVTLAMLLSVGMIILAVGSTMGKLSPSSLSSVKAIPGNVVGDVVWEPEKWARVCGQLVYIADTATTDKQQGKWLALWNGHDEKIVFLSTALLRLFSEVTWEANSFYSLQGKVAQGMVPKGERRERAEDMYLRLVPESLIAWEALQIFIKQEDRLKVVSTLDKEMVGLKGRAKGTVVYQEKRKGGIWLVLWNSQQILGVQYYPRPAANAKEPNGKPVRIGDVIETEGIIQLEEFQDTTDTEDPDSRPAGDPESIFVLEAPKTNGWLQVQSNAQAVVIEKE